MKLYNEISRRLDHHSCDQWFKKQDAAMRQFVVKLANHVWQPLHELLHILLVTLHTNVWSGFCSLIDPVFDQNRRNGCGRHLSQCGIGT